MKRAKPPPVLCRHTPLAGFDRQIVNHSDTFRRKNAAVYSSEMKLGLVDYLDKQYLTPHIKI